MRTLMATLVLGLIVAGTVPAAAQTVPASWAGIWEFTTVDSECDGPFIDTYVDTDTLCAGEELLNEEEGVTLECTGSVDDTTIDLVCSASETEGPCTTTITFTIQGTRTGDTFSGTETTEITFSGCGPIPDQCIEGTVTGVRTGGEPPECVSTATVPASWGTIKTRYGS